MLGLYYNPFEVSVKPFVLKGLAMPSRKPPSIFLPQRPITSTVSALQTCLSSGLVNSYISQGHTYDLGCIPSETLPSPSFTPLRDRSASGHVWLDRIVARVYSDWEPKRREDHELKSITLRLISLARTEAPTLDWACALAVGTTFSKWVKFTNERRDSIAEQLELCIPDFDPTSYKKSPHSVTGKSDSEEIA